MEALRLLQGGSESQNEQGERMKIDELIARLGVCADHAYSEYEETTMLKAAETIRLLWEVARETNIAKYKRQIDEMRGEQ